MRRGRGTRRQRGYEKVKTPVKEVDMKEVEEEKIIPQLPMDMWYEILSWGTVPDMSISRDIETEVVPHVERSITDRIKKKYPTMTRMIINHDIYAMKYALKHPDEFSVTDNNLVKMMYLAIDNRDYDLLSLAIERDRTLLSRRIVQSIVAHKDIVAMTMVIPLLHPDMLHRYTLPKMDISYITPDARNAILKYIEAGNNIRYLEYVIPPKLLTAVLEGEKERRRERRGNREERECECL
jgi:hypothetical protein